MLVGGHGSRTQFLLKPGYAQAGRGGGGDNGSWLGVEPDQDKKPLRWPRLTNSVF